MIKKKLQKLYQKLENFFVYANLDYFFALLRRVRTSQSQYEQEPIAKFQIF